MYQRLNIVTHHVFVIQSLVRKAVSREEFFFSIYLGISLPINKKKELFFALCYNKNNTSNINL